MRATASVLALGLLLAACVRCGGPDSQTEAPAPFVTDAAIAARLDEMGVGEADLRGEATWYGRRHHGRTTASGEPFDMHAFTAAHKTLPFDTVVRVIRQDTRQSVIVRINDRGPYGPGRIIDLSRAAAEEIDLIGPGHLPVLLEVLSLP